MSRTLKQLFDYQRFEENRELRQVIDSVHARYAKRELDLDEMDTVAAAGMPVKPESLEKQEK